MQEKGVGGEGGLQSGPSQGGVGGLQSGPAHGGVGGEQSGPSQGGVGVGGEGGGGTKQQLRHVFPTQVLQSITSHVGGGLCLVISVVGV